ncbi:MAG: hypothetical protein KIS81_02890 [Maricaulaceae bacterium]|nr:hypothetical protein [Maricaulaceae bacterium]
MKLLIALLLASVLGAATDTAPRPALLELALAAGHEAPEGAIWRFTLTADMGERGRFVARYDGARPEGERWMLVEPAEDAMSDDLRRSWQGLSGGARRGTQEQEGENAPRRGVRIGAGSGGLFQNGDTSRIISGDVRQLSETPDAAVFAFTPNLGNDDGDAGFSDQLAGEATVSRNGPYLRRLRVYARQSFKPNPAARVHSFEMVMEYAAQPGLPAPVLRRMRTEVDVSALFQRQRQLADFTFSDVEYTAP